MRKNLLLALLLATLSSISNAQQTGDYRSASSGNWGNATVTTGIWETFDGTNWNTTALAPSSTAPTITIRNGHTVTLNSTSSVKDLVIENGATLKSGFADGISTTPAVRNIRLVGTLTNNGTFGGTSPSTDRISIEGYAATGTMTVTGNGTYYVNLIRCNGVAQTVNLVIDANIDMNNGITGYYTGTTGSNSVGQDNDVVNIIINAGKTVKGGTGSYLHSSGSSLTTDELGIYTYTINGTLDFSAATTTTAIIEHSTKADKNVTVNVNGTWKLGAAGFRGISNSSTLTPSNTVINIGSTGVVDASLVNNFVCKNATTGEVGFFNITGNGILKQNPAAGTGSNTTTAFIGTNNVYSPIVFTGASGVFTLNVQNGPDNGKNVVKKQWTVTAPVGASGVTLNFGWLPADQANSFNPASPVIYNYAAANWNTVNTSGAVAGAGTPISPYAIATEATSTFGTFMIGNEAPTGVPLPLDLVSFTSKAINNAVKLSWTTANEDKVKGFEIERKASNGDFETIGTISARNQKSIQEYSFTDYNMNSGVNYYRLKLVDLDGETTYSDIISNEIRSSVKLSAYPNPAAGSSINFSHPAGCNSFEIFGNNGKVLAKGNVSTGATSTTVNISNLEAGLYYAKFSNNATAISFIKQ